MLHLLAQSEMEGWGKFLVPAVVAAVWLVSAIGKYLEQKRQEQEARRRQGTRDQVGYQPPEVEAGPPRIPMPPPLQLPDEPTKSELAREQKRQAEMEAAAQWAREQRKKNQSAFDQPIPPADRPNTVRTAPTGTALPPRAKMGPKAGRTPKQRVPAKQQPRTSPLEARPGGPLVTKELPSEFRDESHRQQEVALPGGPNTGRTARVARTARTARMATEDQSDSPALTMTAAAQRPATRRGMTAEQLRASLNPATLRGAFLLSEVLGKPVSLRDTVANDLGQSRL